MRKHGFDNDRDLDGEDRDNDDRGSFDCINARTLGLGRSIDRFIDRVDAILARPDNRFQGAGRDAETGADSNLFWIYNARGDLHVKATAGYLTTQTGDGGFNLEVRRDGSWSLAFEGSETVIGHQPQDGAVCGGAQTPGSPGPSPDLDVVDIPGTGAAFYDGSQLPPELINGGLGWDTFQGGVGDYMVGGTGTLGGGLAGRGNCAVYTASPGSVLADMQNGSGYGGNAEGNTYVNMNQVRGSLFSNVLIGNSAGTDLKSGGSNSLLISTGGIGFELRPDGASNLLVSTVGGDRVVFDPTHGWALGDDNIMLGFNLDHGNTLDLTGLTKGNLFNVLNGPAVASDFHAVTAAGYDPGTGTGDINDYVKIVDQRDGSHVLFDPTGNVQSAGVELIDLKFVHGLDAASVYASNQLTI